MIPPKKKPIQRECPNDAPLTDEQRARDLPALGDSGWAAVRDRDAIRKIWKFKSFSEAWGFMSRAALLGGKAEPPSRMVQRLQRRRCDADHPRRSGTVGFGCYLRPKARQASGRGSGATRSFRTDPVPLPDPHARKRGPEGPLTPSVWQLRAWPAAPRRWKCCTRPACQD